MTDHHVPSGHWSVPGVSRTRVEAWAPTRDGCIAEAVAGAVESFADVTECTPARYHRMTVRADDDRQVLFGVLDEVLYDVGTAGVVPVWIRVQGVPAGADVELGGVDTDKVRPRETAPKAVARYRIRRRRGQPGWSASVVLAR
jgi:SHS2 domain-containing protein